MAISAALLWACAPALAVADPPLSRAQPTDSALAVSRTSTVNADLAPSATLTPLPIALPTLTPSETRTPTAAPSPSRTRPPTRSPTLTRTPLPGNAVVIGYSAAGRPIEVHRFGDGPIERLIVAGMHGGYEWNTIALADELIAHLTAHPDLVPPDVTLFLLRSLNPDGEARSRAVSGRVNENGVDLNRNWPAFWQAEWPRAGCWNYAPTTSGAGPASEPETQALMDFLLAQRVDALINYHSAAQGIFPGGRPPDPASVSLAEAVAAVSHYPYPPLDFDCHFTGQLIDWASLNGIAALDVELTNHRDTDFEQNLIILSVFLAWRR
jgi:predicted deacylase